MDVADFRTIDEYVRMVPRNVQEILQKVRSTIKQAVPEADNSIRYRMPAFRFHGPLLYLAAFKDHDSLFGAGQVLKEEVAPYAAGKRTLRFSLTDPVPLELIAEIARFRAKQNLARQTEQ